MDTGELMAWRSTAKPHRPLNFKAGETPCEALGARMPPEGEEAAVDMAAGESYRAHRGCRRARRGP